MDKWISYPYNGILFNHKNELKIFTYQNMGDPWKHYVKWMKPVTKDHILYDFIYVKSSIVKYIETESRLVIPSSWDKMGK